MTHETLARPDGGEVVATSRLGALYSSGLFDDTETETFDRLARLTRQLLGVETALVSLVGKDRQVFMGQDGVRADLAAERGSPLSHSYCRFAVATGEPLVVEDARESVLLRDSPAVEERDAVAYAGIPLRLRGGEVAGTLCVIDPEGRSWTEDEIGTLTELAELARAELDHRVRDLSLDQLQTLALRLPDPVARLGDAVRSAASLVERPEDLRLPRTVDVARSRFRTVETITGDLARVAASAREERTASPELVDVAARLRAAVDLASSNARRGDVLADIPDRTVPVRWIRRELDRALALVVVTATHHAHDDSPVRVGLAADGQDATLSVSCPGNAVPVTELLRVVTAFEPAGVTDPVDVAVRATGTRARGQVAEAVATPDSTRITVKLPLDLTGDGAHDTTGSIGGPRVAAQRTSGAGS